MKTVVKMCGLIALFLIGILAISGIANADSVPVRIEKTYIDDKEIDAQCAFNNSTGQYDCQSIEMRGDLIRGDFLDVEVKLAAVADDKYVTVEASLKGLDHDSDKAIDSTDAFSVEANRTYYKKLTIELPSRMDSGQYALRIEISNRADKEIVYNIPLDVSTDRNGVTIKDAVFNPGTEIKAGRSIIANVRVKNVGESTEDTIKVTAKIPELGLSDSNFIDEIEAEDTVTSEDLFLRVPECAKAGTYKLTVEAEFDDGDEKVSKDYYVTVVENEVCTVKPASSTEETGKTIIAVASEPQEITAGQSGVIYPITLSNTGTSARTYIVSATAGDWATVKISPNVVVLGAGETKVVYIGVSAKEGTKAGDQTFGIAVKSNEQTLKEFVLKAKVIEPKASVTDGLGKVLLWAVIGLIILLVIVALVVGFRKIREGDEDSKEDTQTYY